MASVSLSKHFTVLTSILLICGLVVVLGKIQERRNEEQNSRHKERLSPWKRAASASHVVTTEQPQTTASPVVTTEQPQTTASPVVTTPQSTQTTPVPTLPVPLHQTCFNDSFCHAASTHCIGSVKKTCECMDSHYAYNSTTCLERKKVHETCTYRTKDNNECTRGAECTAAYYCACVPDTFYEEANKTCSERKGENVTCTDSKECIPNAECNNVPTAPPTAAPVKTCQCEQDYYHDTTGFNKCLLKHAIGESCVNITQCVNGATGCAGNPGVCQCVSANHYTTVNGSCLPRQILQGECDDTIPNQCLINGVCLGSHCQCNDHSFRKVDDCTATIAVGNPCDYFNHEVRQCESDTKCVFRYWDDVPVCGCDIDHFFNGHVCQPRALAGDPCPYDPHYPHDSLRLIIDHQCVDNAVCNPTTLICDCDDNHYLRGQHCPPRIEEYGTCDPWANYYDQCIDHYDCVHGRCVPS